MNVQGWPGGGGNAAQYHAANSPQELDGGVERLHCANPSSRQAYTNDGGRVGKACVRFADKSNIKPVSRASIAVNQARSVVKFSIFSRTIKSVDRMNRSSIFTNQNERLAKTFRKRRKTRRVASFHPSPPDETNDCLFLLALLIHFL